MKNFLEEYGFAILAAIVVILLIAMASPVSNTIKKQTMSLIDKFANVSDEKLISTDDEVSVILTDNLNLTITSKSSTDKFDYIIHYKEKGEEKTSLPRHYEEGFIILENCDKKSKIYIEVINTGNNKRYYSNSLYLKTGNQGMKENEITYKVNHYQQNLLDNEYTLIKTEVKVGDKNSLLNTSQTQLSFEGFNYKESVINDNATKEIELTEDTTINNYYDRKIFWFDINNFIDGIFEPSHKGSIFKFDLYINDILVGVDISDWNLEYRYGTKYELRNFEIINPNYEFIEWYKIGEGYKPKGVITKLTYVIPVIESIK